MAQCLRRPLGATLHFQPSLLPARRCFSQSFLRAAKENGYHSQKPPAERSIRVLGKEQQQLVADVGLFPSTFIPPTGLNRPPLTRPGDLLKLYWIRLRTRLSDLVQLGVYKFMISKNKPRPKLEFRQIKPTAVALHRQMYTAFAEGDLATLKKVCVDGGLLQNFIARIHARGKDKMQWEMVKLKRARVVSNRAFKLPVDHSGMRQAVVRVVSRQKLTRYRPDGSVVAGSGKEKDVVEYVVIQRRLMRGKESPWQVWGTTEETSLEKLEEERRAMLA